MTPYLKDILFIFIFIIVLALLAHNLGILAAVAALFISHINDPDDNFGDDIGDTDDSQNVQSDNPSDNQIIGGNDTDAKNLTMAKMRQYAKKQLPFESFLDKIMAETNLFIKSLAKKPTDYALGTLSTYKPILIAAADILDKKYTDSRLRPAELRELAREIGSATSKKYDNMIHLGNISKEEFAARYISLMTDTNDTISLTECRQENVDLRLKVESLREEIRRGLTNYTCEAMLRDCRDEKRRLQEQIDIMRTRGNFTDRTQVQNLENRIIELQSIIQAMQTSDSNLSDTNRNEINNLHDQLNKCTQDKEILINSITQFSTNTGMDVPITNY